MALPHKAYPVDFPGLDGVHWLIQLNGVGGGKAIMQATPPQKGVATQEI